MKRILPLLLLLLVAVVNAAAAPAGEKKMRIGWCIATTYEDTFINNIMESVQRYASRHPEIKIDIMRGQEDVMPQQDQVEMLLRNGAAAVVVIPTVNASIPDIEKLTRDAKVPLVFVNRNPYYGREIPEGVYYVGANSRLEGEEQMRHVGKLLGGKGNIALLLGEEGHEGTINRTIGLKNVIQNEFPGITIVAEATANWSRSEGKGAAEEILGKHGDSLDAIVSNNDEMAMGALEAIEEMSLTRNIVVAGIDAIDSALLAIEEGRLAATILQDSEAQGVGGTQAAIKAAKGEKVDQLTLLPVRLVTRDNVAEIKAMR